MSAVNIGDCTGSITIRDYDFHDGGISLSECPGTITITQRPAWMLIGGGEEYPVRIAFSDTTFSASSIIQDATGRSGGLRKDPMDEGNSGLNPAFIFSLIDFDGNGCADYPPERNLKKAPEYTECVVEGVPPP